jgi:hypothetical protein
LQNEIVALSANKEGVVMFPYSSCLPSQTSFHLPLLLKISNAPSTIKNKGSLELLTSWSCVTHIVKIGNGGKTSGWTSLQTSIHVFQQTHCIFGFLALNTHLGYLYSSSFSDIGNCNDDGVLNVDVVNHQNFKTSERRKALHVCETQIASAIRFEKLFKGNFVVVNLTPSNSDWYTWPYVIAQITSDVSTLDTESPETVFQVQVYCPCGSTLSLSKKLSHGLVRTVNPGDQQLTEVW